MVAEVRRVGPICVAEHLVPFLPGHGIFGNSQNQVSAAPFGSAGILPYHIRIYPHDGCRRTDTGN